MIFTQCTNDFWLKRKIDNFDPYNAFLAIATNIPQRIKTGFVVQDHICQVDVHMAEMYSKKHAMIIYCDPTSS